jgi:rRNA maturation protein Nop10
MPQISLHAIINVYYRSMSCYTMVSPTGPACSAKVSLICPSRFDLSDHLSEERVERDSALYELLNENIGFLVNPNLRIKNLVSLVPFVFTCFTIVIYLLVETSLSLIFVA